jgi:hypothetical protein
VRRQQRRLRSTAQAVVRAQVEETPSKFESSGGNEEEEEGQTISTPHSSPPKISPHLVTFLVSKRGSQLVLIEQNAPRRMPVGCLALHYSSTSCQYVSSCRECVLVLLVH